MRGRGKTLTYKQPGAKSLDIYLESWADKTIALRRDLLNALPNLNPNDAMDGERGTKVRRAHYGKLALLLADNVDRKTPLQHMQTIMLCDYGMRRLLFSHPTWRGFRKEHGTLIDTGNPFKRKKLTEFWKNYRQNTLVLELQELTAANNLTRLQAAYILKEAQQIDTIQEWWARHGASLHARVSLVRTNELLNLTKPLVKTPIDQAMHLKIEQKLAGLSARILPPNQQATTGLREDILRDLEDVQLYLSELLDPHHLKMTQAFEQAEITHRTVIEKVFKTKIRTPVFPLLAPELQFFISPENAEDSPNTVITGQYQGGIESILIDRERTLQIIENKNVVNKTLLHELIHAVQAERTTPGSRWEQFIKADEEDRALDADYVWAKLERVFIEARTEEAALVINKQVKNYNKTQSVDQNARPSYNGYRIFHRAALHILAGDSRSEYDDLILQTAGMGQGEYLDWLFKELSDTLGKPSASREVLEYRLLKCAEHNQRTQCNDDNVISIIDWLTKIWQDPQTQDELNGIKAESNLIGD